MVFHMLKVVDVDIQSCDKHLDGIKAEIKKHSESNPGHRYLILNFGVAAGDP